jgi:hypothetical protein
MLLFNDISRVPRFSVRQDITSAAGHRTSAAKSVTGADCINIRHNGQ